MIESLIQFFKLFFIKEDSLNNNITQCHEINSKQTNGIQKVLR